MTYSYIRHETLCWGKRNEGTNCFVLCQLLTDFCNPIGPDRQITASCDFGSYRGIPTVEANRLAIP